MSKNRLIYHKQTSIQQLLRNKLNVELFTCYKLKIYFISTVLHIWIN